MAKVEYNPSYLTHQNRIHYVTAMDYFILPDGQRVKWCKETSSFEHKKTCIVEYVFSIFKQIPLGIEVRVGDHLITPEGRHWLCYTEDQIVEYWGGYDDGL